MNESMPFPIPLAVELAAVALGALQGALLASAFTDRRIDVLGAVLVGRSRGRSVPTCHSGSARAAAQIGG